MSQKRLLVEGYGDKIFFESLFKELSIADKVTLELIVNTPKDFGSEKDGLPEIKKRLPRLLDQLTKGQITHLGIVIDADYRCKDFGVDVQLKSFNKRIASEKYGYNEATAFYEKSGWLFNHKEGRNPIGLWIMQNNDGEGMFEDFFLSCMKEEDKIMQDYAHKVVARLSRNRNKCDSTKEKLFAPHHQSKACVGTWNAWQKPPSHDITIEKLDQTAAPMQSLIQWLKKVYDIT